MKRMMWSLSFVAGLGLGVLLSPGCGDQCGGCAAPPSCASGEPPGPCSCGCGALASVSSCVIEDGVHFIETCDAEEVCMQRTPCADGLVCVQEDGVATCSM